jgi:hypothetical protein
MASRHRTLGRVVGIAGGRAYCVFALIGYGVAVGIPLELLEGHAAVGFHFFVEMASPSEVDEWGSVHTYLSLDLSGFGLDHDQRVPSWDETINPKSEVES